MYKRQSKTVSVKNLENGEIFEENYDKLILSPGAKPTQPRFPGVGIDKLFTLRTVEDTFRIKEYINKNHPKSAVLALSLIHISKGYQVLTGRKVSVRRPETG